MKKRSRIKVALQVAKSIRRKADGGPIPDVGDPLIGDGGQFSAGSDSVNKAADIGSKVAYNSMQSLATLPQRAIQNSQFSLDTGNYDPGPTLEAATLPMGTGAVAGVPVKGAEAVLGAGPIRAYHGSPHDFDAFDTSKIGTGEGAQSYGHGLYFADNESVAKSYRDALSPDPVTVDYLRHNDQIDKQISDLREGVDNAKQQATTATDPDLKKWYEMTADHYEKQASQYEKLKVDPSATTGKMYQVDINADPEHFLDFDKPLNKQAPQVQDALKKAMGASWDSYKYADASSAVRKGLIGFRDETVAKKLNEAGIPGIKYLDQGSRAKGDGSRNYVVFNDKLVDIIKKYGMAGIPAAGAAAASLQGGDEHMAKGGLIQSALRVARKANGGGVFSGYIHGTTGGRTDNKPIDVASGSYVVPADILSGLGEGNSHAGWAALQSQLGMGAPTKADGGSVGAPTPIVAASGEAVIPPESVAQIGGGDVDRGHKVLDALVKHVRSKTIKKLKSLPAPKKN